MGERDSADSVGRHRKEINIRNNYSKKKNNKLKVTTEVEADINDEVVNNESIVVGAEVLRENDLEKKKIILINILKNKDDTVASILSTLMNSSKDLIDESKYS